MLVKPTERTHALRMDLIENITKLEVQYRKDQNPDTLILLDEAKNYFQIFQMTLDSLDAVN